MTLTWEERYKLRNNLLTPQERYEVEQKLVTEEFLSRYPQWGEIATEANAKLLRQAVEQAIDNGAPLNADTLSACYHHLNAAGKFEQAEQEVTESQEEYYERRRIEDLAKHADQMSDSDLEKQLLRAGIYVSRRSTI